MPFRTNQPIIMSLSGQQCQGAFPDPFLSSFLDMTVFPSSFGTRKGVLGGPSSNAATREVRAGTGTNSISSRLRRDKSVCPHVCPQTLLAGIRPAIIRAAACYLPPAMRRGRDNRHRKQSLAGPFATYSGDYGTFSSAHYCYTSTEEPSVYRD